MSYAAKEIKRLSGRALHRWKMISGGDRIMVAVSGGKDSLALLWLLRERLARVPVDYELTAVHVDPGFGADSAARTAAWFEENGFVYRVIRSDFGPRAHGPENRENPCFLCSRLRRKALFEKAAELGCSKIAFGHHKDDVIETLFVNIFYGASISTMKPVQTFFNGEVTVIRPLYLVDESLVERYSREMGWPEIDLGCPSAGSTKRKEVRDMLRSFYRRNRKIKGNIFHALSNVREDYLP
ncbi:MAG: ATP-binding protein [Desulfobacteraceae bacterium]